MPTCPDCHTFVSGRATTCPHCGFRDIDPLLPIAMSQYAAPKPMWHFSDTESDLERLLAERLTTSESSREVLGEAENLMRAAPALEEFVRSLFPDTVKVAQITNEMQHLIDSGNLRFRFDKSGEMLAQLATPEGRISENLRLRDLALTADLGTAAVNLQLQLTMMQILGELRSLQQQIEELRASMQDDRLAIADSAWQQLLQAASIKDSRLRERKTLDALARATDAKCQLVRTFQRNQNRLEEKRNRRGLSQLKGDRNGEDEISGEEALSSLMAIVETVHIEITAYTLVGEHDAALTSLRQFDDFITSNKLDDRNTLLHITSFTDGNHHKELVTFFEETTKTAKKILSPPNGNNTLSLEAPHEEESE